MTPKIAAALEVNHPLRRMDVGAMMTCRCCETRAAAPCLNGQHMVLVKFSDGSGALICTLCIAEAA